MVDAPQFDSLYTLAEMAVAMLSVAGLIAVFLARGALVPVDRIRFVLIVLLGALVAVCAFIPVWVARYVAQESLWQVSAVISLIGAVPVFTVVRRAHAEVRELFKLLRSVSVVPTAIGLTNTILIIMNSLSWPIQSNQTFYEAVMVGILCQMAFQFTSLVIYRDPVASD